MTWRGILRAGYNGLNLNLSLLQEIHNNLCQGRKVKVGRKVLKPSDRKIVESLINKQIQKREQKSGVPGGF